MTLTMKWYSFVRPSSTRYHSHSRSAISSLKPVSLAPTREGFRYTSYRVLALTLPWEATA